MANEIKPTQALYNLRPKCTYTCRDTDGPDWTVEWHAGNPDPEPSRSEIQAEIDRLQAEYDNKQYQRNRAKEYPTLVDQLDDIYHNGIDGWKATIKATKDKYPKS